MKVPKEIKTAGAVLMALLCCPETYCDGAVQVQAHDVNLMAELSVITQAAQRNHCKEDDFIILLAIRLSENGRPGREFGVLHPKCQALCEKHPERTLDIQAGWSAATIVKNRKRWHQQGSKGTDFIDFLGDRYCPKEADPEGNINWKRNVSYWYEKLKSESK